MRFNSLRPRRDAKITMQSNAIADVIYNCVNKIEVLFKFAVKRYMHFLN